MQFNLLKCDKYLHTIGATFYKQNIHETPVVFEAFIRKLPNQRNFLVFAGLAPFLHALENFEVDGKHIAFLKTLPEFENVPEGYFNYLTSLNFSDVSIRALPEGTVFFANTPMIQVSGPLFKCQLIETFMLSILNYSTAVASKAARIRLAAGEKAALAEFGYRRAPSSEAANLATRAAFIGGFDTTSNLEASYEYGIPNNGTMSHSFILANDSEKVAFESFKDVFKKGTALIDTYNPLEGVKQALGAFGEGLLGVRLDSGDKLVLSRSIRALLDENNFKNTKIIVSDDMDENTIKRLRLFDAPIDGWGVGTSLVNPGALGGVYKLVEKNYNGVAKLSENKATYPLRKHVCRIVKNDTIRKDVIVHVDEFEVDGYYLLNTVFLNNQSFTDNLETAKQRCEMQLSMLPNKYKELDECYTFDVEFSETLENELEKLRK